MKQVDLIDKVKKETAQDICGTIIARCNLARQAEMKMKRATAVEAYQYVIELAKTAMALYGVEEEE